LKKLNVVEKGASPVSGLPEKHKCLPKNTNRRAEDIDNANEEKETNYEKEIDQASRRNDEETQTASYKKAYGLHAERDAEGIDIYCCS
tara:strand:- start:122 stop:385 length:264 start_codon:yes stop_codon:yes gene_type:complete